MEEDITLFLAIEKFVDEKACYVGDTKVLDDKDLAELFEIDLIEFRESIKENIERFPSDFMIETKGCYAFTETGVIMLGGILETDRAIKYHMQFIKYFVSLSSKLGISIFDILPNNKEIE